VNYQGSIQSDYLLLTNQLTGIPNSLIGRAT
jgi:hypothetical protein